MSGKPYCAEHAAVAYVKPREKERREDWPEIPFQLHAKRGDCLAVIPFFYVSNRATGQP
jgi:hypothetical protein